MKKKVDKEGLCSNVKKEEKIMKNNLKNINKEEKWLIKQLKVKGYSDISKILLATVDINDKIAVYERNKNVEPLDVLE